MGIMPFIRMSLKLQWIVYIVLLSSAKSFIVPQKTLCRSLSRPCCSFHAREGKAKSCRRRRRGPLQRRQERSCLKNLQSSVKNDDETTTLPTANIDTETIDFIQHEEFCFNSTGFEGCIVVVDSNDASTTGDSTIKQTGDDSDDSTTTALWTMSILCFGVTFLSALDRVSMSVALVPMSFEFGYTETIKGQISSLFSIGYGLAIVPSGLLMKSSKSSSPTSILAFGIFIWSIATCATPLVATDLNALLTTRAIVGASEAVVLPSLQTLVSNWIVPGFKSLAMAGIFAGFQAGTVAAYLLSPIIMDYNSDKWQSLFTTYGVMGLVWLVPWLIWAKDSPPSALQPVENDKKLEDASFLTGSTETSTTSTSTASKTQDDTIGNVVPWKEFISSKGFWAMLLAHGANNWGLYNNLSWTPTFYAEQYGLNVHDSAWYSVMPSITGAICGLVAGASADVLLQKLNNSQQSKTLIRRIYQGIALYGPAAMLTALAWHIPIEPTVAQTLLMSTVGLQAFNAAGYGAANQEKAGPMYSALLYSLTSLPGVAFGSLGVYATGQVLDMTHDWSIVFYLNALVNVIGATAFVTLYDSKREWD